MARPKKNGTYLNVCVDTSIYSMLEEMCETLGQTKTVAVERALTSYLQEYKQREEKLRMLEKQNSKVE